MKSGARADVSIPRFQQESFRREDELVAIGGARYVQFYGTGRGSGYSGAQADDDDRTRGPQFWRSWIA